MTALIRDSTRRKLHSFPALLGPLMLSVASAGCATVYEGKYPFSEGWRTATALSVVSGAQLSRPDYWECTRTTTAANRAGKAYAVVRYASAKSTDDFAVEADASAATIAKGTRVYVNVFDCKQSPVARIAPVKGTS